MFCLITTPERALLLSHHSGRFGVFLVLFPFVGKIQKMRAQRRGSFFLSAEETSKRKQLILELSLRMDRSFCAGLGNG
jgi:hypothetical protein